MNSIFPYPGWWIWVAAILAVFADATFGSHVFEALYFFGAGVSSLALGVPKRAGDKMRASGSEFARSRVWVRLIEQVAALGFIAFVVGGAGYVMWWAA